MSDPYEWLTDLYAQAVRERYPGLLHVWPVISGADARVGDFDGWEIWAFTHTGNSVSRTTKGLGELPLRTLGIQNIGPSNIEFARAKIERYLRLSKNDCILLCQRQGENISIEPTEFEAAIRRHEVAMGLGAMRIFLSHKGADKPMVRDFDRTLRLLGFDTWLDEDALTAGAHLERGISKGLEESCAAIFFITKNYKDEGYLATEVDYAIREKRAKGDAFQIIIIAFDGVKREEIPDLLRSYVWKTPSTQQEAVQEILKALPLKVGDVYWR